MSSNTSFIDHLNHNQQQQQQEQQLQQPGQFNEKIFLNKTELDWRIFSHPTLAEYYHNLTPFVTLSIFVGAILVILNIAIFSTTLQSLRRRVEAHCRKHTVFMCSLYPIISCAALATILLPKSWLICHTVMHLSFTLGAVVFYSLCFRYVDSEVNYLKEVDGAVISIRTPPCCCCCLCLPTVIPSRAKLCILRYMVWQMPLVQGSIMLVLNMIYYKEQALYYNVSLYFIPFLASSILIGMWGLNITARIINAIHSKYNTLKKVFCLQLIMLLCKMQYMVLDSQLNRLVLGGDYPINHTIYKQTIINLLILCEMVLVSMLVQNAYKVSS